MTNYWIASNRPFEGRVATNPRELSKLLDAYSPDTPKAIYFPFWSWKVPLDILQRISCIGFHSAPLPRGRGGSPIQNMIRSGYEYTEVCAFRMTEDYDDGEILIRTPVSLSGDLQTIVNRISTKIEIMIPMIDQGKHRDSKSDVFGDVPAHFKRITNNTLPETETLSQLFDEIRMRDDVGHPKAIKYHGKYTIEFTNAYYGCDDKLYAKVRIYES